MSLHRDASAPAGARRRWAIGAYLTLCSLVLGALAGEVALRLERRRALPVAERFAAGNPFLRGEFIGISGGVWAERFVRYRPGASLSFERRGQRYEVHINRHGFRTRDFEIPKPLGTLRVLCLGGSTTVQGLTNDTTYPALLEVALRHAFPEQAIEVLNVGVSGTQSGYWVERLERLLAMEPDLVVEYSGVNDLLHAHLPRWIEGHPLAAAPYPHSLLWSRLVPHPAAQFDALFARTFEHFRRVHDACRERGADYLLGTFAAPDPDTIDSELAAFLDSATAYWTERRLQYYEQYWRLIGRYNALLEAFAEREGIPCVPLHAAIARGRLFTDLCHMRPRGIEKMAEAFYPQVAARIGRRIQARAGR